MSDDRLHASWNAITAETATTYLEAGGSSNSRRILADVVRDLGAASAVDLGCGNAHLLEVLRERGWRGAYTGVEVSEPLLEAARTKHGGDPHARFVTADVHELAGVEGPFDVAIYSHTLEMLPSPEASLAAAARVAGAIVIRFFEPPDHDFDRVDLRTMDVGGAEPVPYLRRSMSRDAYRLALAKIGASRVEVYRDELSTDQVHLVRL